MIRSRKHSIGRREHVTIPVHRETGPDVPPWYFHPQRGSCAMPTGCSRSQVEHFRTRLKQISPELDLSWHPIEQRWQIWTRDLNVKSPWCAGWRRLFFVQDFHGEANRLDERVFAELFLRDGSNYRNGADYFERIRAEKLRAKEARRAARHDETSQYAREYWDYTKIKVAMWGESSGSKFHRHHSE